MVAFKPFAACPINQRPIGIPLGYPWLQQSCTEQEISVLRKKGWTVVSDSEYEDYLSSLSEEIEAWLTVQEQLKIEAVVSDAAKYGTSLMITYAAENVLLGITQEGMTGTVLTKLADVQLALQAGSLYEAINRIRAIPLLSYDSKYITEARLLNFINKIELYLGIPLSSSV